MDPMQQLMQLLGVSSANASPLSQLPAVAPQMAPPPVMPPQAPVIPANPQVAAAPPPMPTPSLGASLEPSVPMPMAKPPELLAQQDATQDAQQDATDATAAPAAPGAVPGSALLQTLKGVQMPAPPQAQKVGTPHAPQLRPIQGGGLTDLLASLGIGPQQAMPGLKLPSTLGQALGGR